MDEQKYNSLHIWKKIQNVMNSWKYHPKKDY